jgi:hypothetical protein
VTVSQIYFVAIFAIGIAIYFVRRLLLSPVAPSVSVASRSLSPTEVAYLTKEGDDGFALLVLLFDLMHREVKDKIVRGEIETFDANQKPYELALRKAAGGSIKDWSMRKVEGVVGSPRKDPVRFVMKLPALYKFTRTVVEDTIKDLFRDPRNIKKFISVAGLMRLAADIGATGYKVTLARELKENLTADGFLASDTLRNQQRNALVAAFIVCEVLVLLLTLYTIPSALHAWLIFFCALFAAFVVQAVSAVREFIPLYSELAQALALVQQNNLRIRVIRTLLNIFTLLLNSLSVLVFVILFGSGSLFLYLTQTVTTFETYLMLIGQMLTQILAFACLTQAYKITLGEMPTRQAQRAINALKEKYKQEATLPSLKAALSQNDYGPELSFLIALYGLETLFLI